MGEKEDGNPFEVCRRGVKGEGQVSWDLYHTTEFPRWREKNTIEKLTFALSWEKRE